MENSLSHQSDLEIEDILNKLQEVTKPLPDYLDDEDQIKEFHQRLITDLDVTRFNKLYDTLCDQFEKDENTLIRKASDVEQLVLRLQLDELNELGRAQECGIIQVNKKDWE